MASTYLKTKKDGSRYFLIVVSAGHGKTSYRARFDWPMTKDGKPVAESTARERLKAFVDEFTTDCSRGLVLTKKAEREKKAEEARKAAEEAARAAAEAAKLKTVRQYADGVFMPAKEVTISENARYSYRKYLDKHILPVIGDLLLVDVTPAILQKLIIDYQRAGYKHASVVKLYNVLNGLFDMAFMDDSIPISPMLKVKRPAPRKDEALKEDHKLALTAQELRTVLSCVAQEPLKWQAYIFFLADSGARKGEACGLQWNDIDFKNGKAKIQRNLQYTPEAGVYVTTPKNGQSRTVDLGADTISLLQQLRTEQAASCISKWIFTRDGSADPMHPQTPTRYFAKFGARYGIENFHPHLLRHTSCSLAVANGADYVSLAKRIGHSDPSFTMRVYAHANEEGIKKAGQVVRDAVKTANDF